MATSCTDSAHPLYDLYKREDYPGANFFLKNKERNRFATLGEALDLISAGGINYVAYPDLDTQGLTRFIGKWIKEQPYKKEIKEIPSEKFKGVYDISIKNKSRILRFNHYEDTENVNLPLINYETCPRNTRHKLTIEDRAGRVRCAHEEIKQIKNNFFNSWDSLDEFSGMTKRDYYDDEPSDPLPDDAWNEETGELLEIWKEESEEYKESLEQFNEDESSDVKDICYSIITEPKNIYLPLETVLDRLNCNQYGNNYTNPFSGFNLANYVQAWWEQPGRKKIWRKNGSKDSFRLFRDFQFISSDD